MNKDVVAGLGEIGNPIYKILSKQQNVIGYDKDTKLINQNKYKKFETLETCILHIAIPVNKKFNSNVIQLYKKFFPKCIVIHSTVSPGTTQTIQKK